MDHVARLAVRERSELFAESAARMGTTPAVVEKDFWVSWVLCCLFADTQLANWLMFKGGTSLSKAYGLIQRFSEDIDLVLDWRTVSEADPLAERSQTQQNKLNAAIEAKAVRFIAGDLLGRIRAVLGELCVCEVEANDTHVINVRYPAAFPDAYLRPEVRLEIGPLAAWLPHELRRVSCYAAEQFPAVFTQRNFEVRVIRAERTFWEKATILHHEAHRPAGNLQPARYSRHYYDLARMAASPVRAAALADFDLLAEVVAFKRRFYPRGWAHYELAVPGSLSLVPHGEVLKAVEADYRAMQGMIFGSALAFQDILLELTGLESEINRGK
jgi:hypothetical protein